MGPVTTVKATSHRKGRAGTAKGGPGVMGRGAKITLSVLLGILAVALAIYLADLATHRGNVPRGTEVGGVDIGAMAPDEAREKLQAELGGVADKAVPVKAGEKATEFVPAKSGLGIDFDATVDAAGMDAWRPVSTGAVQRREYPGGHHPLAENRHRLLEDLEACADPGRSR